MGYTYFPNMFFEILHTLTLTLIYCRFKPTVADITDITMHKIKLFFLVLINIILKNIPNKSCRS